MKTLVKLLASHKFTLHSEKELQREILDLLIRSIDILVNREYRLDSNNIIDFYCDGVGIVVKIKGNRKEIFKQCQRYCEFDEIKSLVLVTNRAMGLPAIINNKPCVVVNLGMGWL